MYTNNSHKMKYECKCCQFKTDDKTVWFRHKKSKKHARNSICPNVMKTHIIPKLISHVESDNINTMSCNYCGKIYSTKFNLNKHLLTCKIKQNTDIKNQIEEKYIKKELENAKNIIISQHNDIEYYKTLLTGAGKTISALAFCNVNYKDAPKLIQMGDNAPILNINDENLVKSLVYHYDKKTLAQYIGNHIVIYYKKDNPEEQSVWSTDSVRLNYIIKQVSNWVVDKKGTQLCSSIINPLLDKIRSVIVIVGKNEKKNITDDFNVNHNIMLKLNKMDFILLSIDNGKLAQAINKYIAPRLHMDNNSEL